MIECMKTMGTQEKLKKRNEKMQKKLEERKKQHSAIVCSFCGKLISLDKEYNLIYEKGYGDGWSDYNRVICEELENDKRTK